MEYMVSKEKGNNLYYVHKVGDKTPIPGTYGDKKKAMKTAAKMNGVDLKTFLRMRKECEQE